MSMEAIARQRAVQLGTVQSYIAEAMAAGYSYPWHRMGIPFTILASLCGHMRAYHKQQQLCMVGKEDQADDYQTQSKQPHQQRQHGIEGCSYMAPSHDSLNPAVGLAQQVEQSVASAKHAPPSQGLRKCQEAQLHVDAELASHDALHGIGQHSMQSTGVCSQCGLMQDESTVRLHPSGLVTAGSQLAPGADEPRLVQLPDMQSMQELVLTSRGTKALRDSMDTCLLTYGQMRLALAHIYCLLRHQVCLCQQCSSID